MSERDSERTQTITRFATLPLLAPPPFSARACLPGMRVFFNGSSLAAGR